MRIVIPNDFTPRASYQREPMAYLDAGGKRCMCVWHRRSGKDLTMLHQTCKMAHTRIGTYWHIFPTAEQGRKSIWTEFRRDGKRIMENVFPLPIRKSPREWNPQGEMVVELKCGSVWRLMGSDKIDVVGAGPVGVVFSEFALAKPNTWALVRPMLRQNDGWAAFIFTPRGNNHARDLYTKATKESGWFRDLKTVYDTGQQYASVRRPGTLLTPDEMMAEERADGMADAMIRQEYLCDWTAANVGSVWGELLEALEKGGAISDFIHPLDGVYTTWDLGVSDATAIWFWRINEKRTVDLIDHYEATGQPMSHYFDEVDRRGYKYLKHWLPHDARQRTWQTAVSTVDMFIDKFGAEKVGVTPNLTLPDGIQAGRWLLQQPLRIHSRCAEGVEALRQYHYIWDEDSRVFGTKPEHDWSSHSADAFRYVAVVAKTTEQVTRSEVKTKKPVAVPIHNSFTLDDLFEARERERRS